MLKHHNLLVDPEVKQKLDADIREAQEEISLCDAQKAEINKGIDGCDVENREFEKRFVSEICLKNIQFSVDPPFSSIRIV